MENRKLFTRKKTLIFIVIIALLLIFWPKKEEPSQEQAVEELELVEEEEPPQEQNPPQVVKAPEPVASTPAPKIDEKEKDKNIKAIEVKPNKGKERKLPKGVVEFELKNGDHAVAFGDVVLGKVISGVKGKRGFYKPKKQKLWDSNEIPYAFHKGLSNQRAVLEAIEYFHENTPIRFVPYIDQPDALVFSPSEDLRCGSYLGRVGGLQPVFLKSSCTTGDILHELMHALGFVHEHSRADRDKYLEVFWDNILDDKKNQFDIIPDSFIHEYVGSIFDFDYSSIMLYSGVAFVKKPGLYSLKSKTEKSLSPSVDELSAVDIERLQYLYGP